MWITDPKTKQKSVTLTLFVAGFAVLAIKLAVSGLTLGGLTMEKFSGTDFAAGVASLGGVYAFRRRNDSTEGKK